MGKPTCSYCRVQLEDQNGSMGMTMASGNGEFHFSNLRQENYKIRVSSVDYEEVSMTVSINAELTRVTIDLKSRKSETVSSSAQTVLNLSTALESQSRDIVELYKKALKNRQKNRFAEAAVQYESIAYLAPQLYVAHFDLGLSYEAVARLDDAEREFQISRQLDATSAGPLIHLGEIYILRREWGWATEASIGAIRLDSKVPQAFLNLGLALYCNGLPDLSRTSLDKALEMDPKLDQARLLLVNIYLNDHNDRSALAQLDLYFSKGASRSRSADLAALRAQLKSGAPHEDGLEIAVPISIGSISRKSACRE
jgi:tetratricopeptide (TPR) repeat protein